MHTSAKTKAKGRHQKEEQEAHMSEQGHKTSAVIDSVLTLGHYAACIQNMGTWDPKAANDKITSFMPHISL